MLNLGKSDIMYQVLNEASHYFVFPLCHVKAILCHLSTFFGLEYISKWKTNASGFSIHCLDLLVQKKVNKQNLYFERIICFKAETEDANSYIFQTFC